MDTLYLFLDILFYLKWTMALNTQTLPIQKAQLFEPPLEEIANFLKTGLKLNFREVEVQVVDCPDLTQEPFTLAGQGLTGNQKLLEIGGPPFLLPLVQRNKVYELKEVVGLIKQDPAFIIGAGAGPHPHSKVNCEGIYNLKIAGQEIRQGTRISKVDDSDERSIQEILPQSETRLALLGNLFVSEGNPGKVLKVHVKTRIGPKDFIASIRQVLEASYKNNLVGLGGTFLIKQGKAKQHVMRDFSAKPIESEEEVNNWLKFFNMSAPLIAVGTLVNNDGGDLDLRVQHFHSFSHHGEAGHYHNDVTPELVEYLGFFNTASELYRVDKPQNTHKLGRD